MAHPIGFKEANNMLLKPPGVDCFDLEVCQGVFKNGDHFVMSRWQLNDEDLEILKQNGGKLYLLFVGVTHPPLIMQARNPLT